MDECYFWSFRTQMEVFPNLPCNNVVWRHFSSVIWCSSPQYNQGSFVISVVQPFVQNYEYDMSLHQLKDYVTPEAFLKFLGVSEDILEASAKNTTPRGSGKSKGKTTGSDRKAIEKSIDFSLHSGGQRLGRIHEE